MTGRSLKAVFASTEARHREQAYIAFERHATSRKGGKGYPARALRNHDYLYILNHEPTRWPAGDPNAANCARGFPFGEVDSSPTKTLLMKSPEFSRFHELAFDKHPAEELYDIVKDPHQLLNIADNKDYTEVLKSLRHKLQKHLIETRDPRALGQEPLWDYYPHYSGRKNPNWEVDPMPEHLKSK